MSPDACAPGGTRARPTPVLLVLTLLVPLVVLGLAGPVRAHHDDAASSVYGNYPSPVDQRNPYARELVAARRHLDATIVEYWRVYRQDPWNVWGLWRAYFAYADAWYRYRRTLDRYWAWYGERDHVLTGRVVSSDISPYEWRRHDQPVAAARVDLYTYVPPGQRRPVVLIGTRTTDSRGAFEFRNLAEGTYSYSITCQGYAPASGRVEVGRDGQRELVVRLSRIRILTGTVLARRMVGNPPADPPPGFWNPVPVAGAEVIVEIDGIARIQDPATGSTASHPEEAWIGRAVTGADGRFRIENIPFSQAILLVRKAGYRSHSEGLRLADEVTDRNVVLTYDGPPIPIARPGEPGYQEIEVAPAGTVDNPVP
jgi:hypothetical protein